MNLIKSENFHTIRIIRSVRRYWESLWDNCSKALGVSTIWFILFPFTFILFFLMVKKLREIREIRLFRYHWESPGDNCSRALEVSTKDFPDNDGRNGLYGFSGKFHIWLIHLFQTVSITYVFFFFSSLHFTSLYFALFLLTDIFSTNMIIIFQRTKMERFLSYQLSNRCKCACVFSYLHN